MMAMFSELQFKFLSHHGVMTVVAAVPDLCLLSWQSAGSWGTWPETAPTRVARAAAPLPTAPPQAAACSP